MPKETRNFESNRHTTPTPPKTTRFSTGSQFFLELPGPVLSTGQVRAPVLYSQMLVIMGSALQVPVVALHGVALHIDGSAEDHSFDTTLGQHS